MEQQCNRMSFVKQLHEFCSKIKLDGEFFEALKNHSNSDYIDSVKKFEGNEAAQKVFIFLEFTRGRGPTKELVKILRDIEQNYCANTLETFNSSLPYEDFGNEIKIPVTKTLDWKSNQTLAYPMEADPRGKCILINNIYGVLDSFRYNSVFEQCYFEVDWENWQNKNAVDILFKLTELSTNESLKKHDALIVMFVCHGQDENILGFDGMPLSIQTIVNLFSEDNCKALQRKPKIFIFNCCRIKSEARIKNEVKGEVKFKKLDSISEEWQKNNKHTLICYVCYEGESVFFDPGDMTDFCKNFTKVIARHACTDSLEELLKRVCLLMEDSPPDIRLLKSSRQIYLNPGYPIK